MKQPQIYRQPFASFGEEAFAIWHAITRNGDGMHPNLVEIVRAPAGLSEQVPADGGFLVSVEGVTAIQERALDVGVLLEKCTQFPVGFSFNAIKLPAVDETSRADGSRFGGMRTYWANEAVTATATKPKFRSMELHLNKQIAVAYVTEELNLDAPALGGFLEMGFGSEVSFKTEDAIVNGDGVGKPLGIIKSGALIEVTPESGQGATTIRAANIIEMLARFWGPSHQSPGACWLIGNDVLPQLLPLAFNNGEPVVRSGPNGGRFIAGIPLLLTEYSAALGTVGDIVLCDLREYIVASKDGIFLQSPHLNFLEDERVFRFTFRVDGQPLWRTPVTPKNASATQSPFIALAGNR